MFARIFGREVSRAVDQERHHSDTTTTTSAGRGAAATSDDSPTAASAPGSSQPAVSPALPTAAAAAAAPSHSAPAGIAAAPAACVPPSTSAAGGDVIHATTAAAASPGQGKSGPAAGGGGGKDANRRRLDPVRDARELERLMQADGYHNISSVTIPHYRVKESYVEYTVECTRGHACWRVYRRYQQFKALDQALRQLGARGTPHHGDYGLLPVLPVRHWIEVTNQSSELVDRRRRFLEIYLQQLVVPKNLFYAARTALYGFLHDGEVPVDMHAVSVKPLLGIATLPCSSTDMNAASRRDGAGGCGSGGDHDAEGVEPGSPYASPLLMGFVPPRPPVLAEGTPTESAAGAPGREGEPEQRIKQQQQHRSFLEDDGDAASSDDDDDAGEVDDADEEDGYRASGAGETGADGGSSEGDAITHATTDSGGADGGDLADLFSSDERLPPKAATCLHCSKEFSSVLYPYRCYFCRERFCRACLWRLRTATPTTPPVVEPMWSPETEGQKRKKAAKGEKAAAAAACVNACGQCTENHTRRWSRLGGTGQGIGDSTSSGTNPHLVTQDGGGLSQQPQQPSSTASHSQPTAPSAMHVSAASSLHGHAGGGSVGVPLCTPALRPAAPPARPPPMLGADSADSCVSSQPPHQIPPAAQQQLLLATEREASPAIATNSNSNTASASPVSAAAPAAAAPTASAAARPTRVGLADFQLLTSLGRGTFGKVIKVRLRATGEIFAMKVMNKSVVYKRYMTSYIKEENSILTMLPPHPYVVRCHFSFQSDYYLFFILDYLPGGELYDLIYPTLRLTPEEARLCAAELVLAIEHIHRYDVVHRDIKPENIVLDADGHLHLTDFGLARRNFSHSRRRSFVGSAEYVAPETIQGECQTPALDWWSLGVLLYEMLVGVAPFHGKSTNAVYENVMTKELDLDAAAAITPAAASLLQGLLTREVAARLQDPAEVRAHPYFAGIDWGALRRKEIAAPRVPYLAGNDVRHFKREFTAEWASVPPPSLPASRRSIEMLNRCFDTVPLVRDGAAPPQFLLPTQLGCGGGGGGGGSSSLQLPSPPPPPFPLCKDTAATRRQQLLLMGVWRLQSVETCALDGRVIYPWGGDVVGLLVFLPSGGYSMQMCPLRRRQLKSQRITHASREELRDVCCSFAAQFGRFSFPVKSTITTTTTTVTTATATPTTTALAPAGEGQRMHAAPATDHSPPPVPDPFDAFAAVWCHVDGNMCPNLAHRKVPMRFCVEVAAEEGDAPSATPSPSPPPQQQPMGSGDDGGVGERGASSAAKDSPPTSTAADGGAERPCAASPRPDILRLATAPEQVHGEAFTARTVMTWVRM